MLWFSHNQPRAQINQHWWFIGLHLLIVLSCTRLGISESSHGRIQQRILEAAMGKGEIVNSMFLNIRSINRRCWYVVPQCKWIERHTCYVTSAGAAKTNLNPQICRPHPRPITRWFYRCLDGRKQSPVLNHAGPWKNFLMNPTKDLAKSCAGGIVMRGVFPNHSWSRAWDSSAMHINNSFVFPLHNRFSIL